MSALSSPSCRYCLNHLSFGQSEICPYCLPIPKPSEENRNGGLGDGFIPWSTFHTGVRTWAQVPSTLLESSMALVLPEALKAITVLWQMGILKRQGPICHSQHELTDPFAKIGSSSPYGRQHGWVLCAQDVRGGTTDCGWGCHSTGIVTCVFSIPVLCRYLPWSETFSLRGRLLRTQQILYKAQEGKNNNQSTTKIKQKTYLSSLCKFLKFTRFTRPFLQVT